MSHFTVLVIGENVDKQLAPYHEFECTGRNDQYIQDVDITEEIRADYEKATSTFLVKDGERVSPYDNRFYRKATPEELELIAKRDRSINWRSTGTQEPEVYEIPEGWEKIEVSTSEEQSFRKYVEEDEHAIVPFGSQPKTGTVDSEEDAEHKYGYALEDENGEIIKIVRRTNPNAKWDWYSVGGRWTGFFKLKPVNLLDTTKVYDAFMGFSAAEMKNFVEMAKEDVSRFEKVADKYGAPTSGLLKTKVKELTEQESQVVYPEHSVGRPGLMTEPAELGYADSARKRDIDFEEMMGEAAARAEVRYDKAMEIFGHLPEQESWDAFRDRLLAEGKEIDNIRKIYQEQPRCVAAREWGKENRDNEMFGFFGPSPDDFLCTKEQYVKRAKVERVNTYAILKDGQWFAQGEMGWFGFSNDSVSKDQWHDQFLKALDELSDDTLLTVVDCHI